MVRRIVMEQLKKSVRERWSVLGLAARLWWAGLATVGVAAVLVLAATTVSDASSHPAPTTSAATKTAGSGPRTSSGSGSAGGSGSMAGMAMGGSSSNSGTGSSSSASSASGGTQTTSTVCSNVQGATTMSNGMVMAPVPSGSPTAAQQAAANQLVAETEATLAKYANLSTATAAGYTPATKPTGYLVHYANWQVAKTDGFDPSNPAFLMYANTVNGPKLMGAMYLGPAPCTPGPDIGGPLTQWHAHDDLCLSGGEVVGKTSASGTCASGVHNTNTYFMLHVWTEPSLAATHQFQPDLTRAELAPIIEGQA
jgi:hypothetical protein